MTNALVAMSKYETYKDSGVEWLGVIPEKWNILPGLTIFSENNRDNKGMKEDQVLSLSYGNIVIKPPEKLVGLVPESFETYQLVEPGDLIIRSMDLQNDKTSLRTGLAKDKGIITSAYINLKVKKGQNSKYWHYYLHSLDTTKVIYKFGSGLRQNLSFLDFKRLPVFDIKPAEQIAIAKYLDRKTTQIDQAIEIKEKQIDLLKERKQILIQNAVTRGLDPKAPMKDSGVEQIGEMPAHWEIKKIKFISNINEKSLDERTDKNFEFDYVDIGSVTFENGIENTERYMFLDSPSRARRLANDGDTIVSPVRTYLKAIDYISKDKENYVYSTGFAVISPRKGIYPKFLRSFVHSNAFTNQVDDSSKGMSYPAINSTQLSNLFVVVPPENEQKQINDTLEYELGKIITVIEKQALQIEKLKEYKSTLINSAVTGKIKVA